VADLHCPNRQRAAELLRKLRRITVEAGATEAEAINAAEKARKLADDHGLPQDEDPVVEVRVEVGRVRLRPIDCVWPAVGRFCHASVVMVPGASMQVAYIGRTVDVLLAEWLHTLLKRHIDKSLAAFKTQAEYKRRKPHRRRVAAAAFVQAMAVALCARLNAMSTGSSGAAKLIEAEAWIADRYAQLRTEDVPSIRDLRTIGARLAGVEAGAAVPISTPVSAQPMIAGLIGGA